MTVTPQPAQKPSKKKKGTRASSARREEKLYFPLTYVPRSSRASRSPTSHSVKQPLLCRLVKPLFYLSCNKLSIYFKLFLGDEQKWDHKNHQNYPPVQVSLCSYKHRRFQRKMLMKRNTLKYFRQNAVGHASTVFVPACSVLAAVTCFIPQFTMDQQNCQVNRVEEWNQTRKT